MNGATVAEDDGGAEGGGGSESGFLDQIKGSVAVLIALAFLIIFVVLVYVMWDKADDANNETAWARWTFLLAGIEAVAFAGAGWLFGKEVHRGQAEAAEKNATKAQKKADEESARAASAEAHGEALRNAIEAKRGQTSSGAASGRIGVEGAGAGTQDGDLDELATLARQAFP